MPDIFDQVAAPAAPPSGGDIFDQVASPQSAAPPAIDYAHPAGLSGPAPQLPAHPSAAMNAGGAAMTPDLEKQVDQAQNKQVENFSQPGRTIGNEIVGGAKDIGNAAAMDFANSHGNPFAPNLTGDAAKQRTNLALGGAAKLIAGGGTALLALDAPQILEIGSSALAGNATARIAMAKIAAGVAAGAGASAAGGAAADKLNLSPQAKSLVQSVAFFLPSLFGAAAGVKSGVGVDAEGNPAAGASAFGGKVRAGAVATPEAYDLRAQVGDTRVGVKIPRPQPAPDPARIFDAEQTDAGTNAVVRAAQKTQQAQQVVAGGPPPPPPGPPLPDAMRDGVISQQTVQNIAQAIHIAPVEQHPQLLMEAHGKLTGYIEKQGRIIGPDGKLQLAETPQQAAKLAQTLINDEVDRQSQAREDAAKQQADVVKQQQADAEKAKVEAKKPNAEGVTPADQQLQRVKTIIDGTTPKPGQHLDETIMRNLNVDRPTAHALIDRYAKEKAQLPTVGSKTEPVVEESRATVDAQIGALKRGDIGVVMLPEGSKYRPAVPAGMKMMAVRGEAPGAGMYLYDPAKVQAATIREAAKNGTHGDLLGHVQPKAELDPAKPTVVVQAQAKDGTPIQDSEVHPERAAAQVASLKERHPESNVVVKPAHQVIAERLADHEPETKSEGGAVSPSDEATTSQRKGDRGESPERAAAERTSGEAAAPEQRTDTARRKAVSEMTPEEMKKELLTSHVVDLPNRRAFDEAQAKEPARSVAMSDADGLKALNDRFGYEAGNELLRAKAEALRAAGVEAYHDKGDEFLYRGESEKDLKERLEQARRELRGRIIEVKTVEGNVLRFKGADFSHGTGKDLDDAEGRLKEHKAEREASGERKRGELRGIAEVGPEDGGVGEGAAAGKSAGEIAAKPSSDVEKQEITRAKGQRVAFKDRDGIEREGVVNHAGERITRIGKYDVANRKVGEPRPELKPGQVGRMAVSELHLDPKRFQYKLGVGAEGVSDLLTGKKWNDDLAGVTSVWRDPADGKVYVVNGHHRATLAKQTRTGNLPVRMIDAKDAGEARSIGALQNIAEGRGTALDAAKFFRDTGTTHEDLEAKGISLGEATAQNGVALANLDDRLFDMVVQGKMGQGRGIAIGRETGDPAIQDAILKLIAKSGDKVSDAAVGELARFAQTAPLRQETVASLFGNETRTESTALDKAQVSAYVLRELGAEKRAFGAVASESRAKTLAAEGKNKIDVAGNAEKASSAEQAREVYLKLSSRRGPIDDILNRAAEERADAKPTQVGAIDQRAYEAVREAVSGTLAGGEGPGAERGEEDARGGPGRADLEAAGQSGFFARRNLDRPVESLALPGMGGEIEKQNESAAATRAELQREDVERSLATAKGDISKAAGAMERDSPLFYGTGAGGQENLFNEALRLHSWEALPEFAEAHARELPANLARAIYSVRTSDGARRYLRLDHDGFFAFNRLLNVRGDGWEAVVHPADLTQNILDHLDLQSSPASPEATRGDVARMAAAARAAVNEYGHLIVAAPDVSIEGLREENQHSWAIRFDLQEQVIRAMAAQPVMDRVRSELTKYAGYDIQDSYTVVAEAVAKSAADAQFLTPAHRSEILAAYTQVLKQQGVDLQYVPAVLPEVEDVFPGEAHGLRYEATGEQKDAGGWQALRKVSRSTGRPDRTSLSDGNGEDEGGGQAAVQHPDARSSDEVTNSATFRRWFGKSKIVDAEGKPLRVYHGTDRDFEEFQRGENIPNATALFGGHGMAPQGHYFTAYPEDASNFAETGKGSARVVPVYLSIQNPLRLNRGFEHSYITPEQLAKYQEDGYDGIIYRDYEEIVAFDAAQIKSALGNRGTFDAHDVNYLHGGVGIAAGALKPLGQIKPVADALAFLGDEADRVAVSRDLHNRLYDLASQDNAAVLRVVQMLKGLPGTAKDQQAHLSPSRRSEGHDAHDRAAGDSRRSPVAADLPGRARLPGHHRRRRAA